MFARKVLELVVQAMMSETGQKLMGVVIRLTVEATFDSANERLLAYRQRQQRQRLPQE